ncbi:putative acid-sensing ion channel 4-like [Penaeus vannamei]|uniref:Putative acid-sensing ion channel 4-like n=1 Tax=Penaeus vannamei TaxID=6689 RepID=A0A423U0M5_PENVA|nr:putative acid-sensing ion channel 4-like [Penaeus vannamei]
MDIVMQLRCELLIYSLLPLTAAIWYPQNGKRFRTQLTFDEEIKSSPLTDLSSKNCFTIFGDLDNEMEDEFIISYAGAEGGITLIMKTEVGDYPGSGLAESTGFLVQVHYRYENPNAFHSGFLVSPGTETRVVLTVHKTERQPKPYSSQCVSSWNETGFEPLLFYSTENFKPSYENYSKEECSHMCSHRKVMQLCRCYQSSERINFNTKDLDVCMTKEEGNCASKVDYELLPDKEKDCNCRPECSLFGFDSRVSTAPFPTPNYRSAFMNKYNFTDGQEATKLVVYFSSMEVEVQREEPRYKDYAALLSALGGVLGLYLGLSLLVIAELVLLLVKGILWCFK